MSEHNESSHFIEQIIQADLDAGFPAEKLRFRFPPEPNGYLHIGHVKAIALNFNLGKKYNAPVNLRFDDTNPAKESVEYVNAIKNDIQWLGYEWAEERYASDYFDQLFAWAKELISKGLAYVDPQDSEEMAAQKGTPTREGTNSPFRDTSPEQNLVLFNEMQAGNHAEGSMALRAKIDMSSPNMLLRDPVIYRILNKDHHRTGSTWCIYPMYDWTHGESDYIEEISHSLCTLEFKPHRDLYEWFLSNLSPLEHHYPKQREFARLNLSYTVTSKRKLAVLIKNKTVSGWDDPRMPTISGLRRRGYTPEALRNFVETAGVSKRENVIDVSLLEYCVREDLNSKASRVMAVLDPIKLVITNYPEGATEMLEAENNPEDESKGSRLIPFSKNLFIERDDFKEEANRKYFRLTLGKEVRLKSAYIIEGQSIVKDSEGNIIEIHCTYDSDSKSGSGSEASQRKVKGTIHWVSQETSISAQVNVYDRLFSDESPDQHKDQDFTEFINRDSLSQLTAKVEPSLVNLIPGTNVQFQRLGYFVTDINSTSDNLIFNKTVGLRDTWSKKSN
ncbi:MAG: glutamine--tRNA ligase/YqeY domain fusion protein [Flavobacteriaceae bacterium]|jgi:glutaminyl-tRNA synthetase|nr:glutamine--tRNA ligase/YqeY domain fusion protein [Flavobacteriaceae bacterium]MDO7581537.1 glutamine--tRNA ligase/YqeY domain fusion protein [Flavobacteriaceae bacterium]MDO7590964.1 glutamine--tRNA ligase/YqeY domain fusion protein [Flavobacteriaceae bacterium]MDO7599478.1 glutamine--tRNA ligase/YqeY domain fusion protein [Flavobacteriaceae bacterium]